MENSRRKQWISFRLIAVLNREMNLTLSYSILGHKLPLHIAYPHHVHYTPANHV